MALQRYSEMEGEGRAQCGILPGWKSGIAMSCGFPSALFPVGLLNRHGGGWIFLVG